MKIGQGRFYGRTGYSLRGTFTLTQMNDGRVQFNSSDDFYFGNSAGGGTPDPRFAFFQGDPTDLPKDQVHQVALKTQFLKIADGPFAVSGAQSAYVPDQIHVADHSTIFLWCFSFPMLLGVGEIEHLP